MYTCQLIYATKSEPITSLSMSPTSHTMLHDTCLFMHITKSEPVRFLCTSVDCRLCKSPSVNHHCHANIHPNTEHQNNTTKQLNQKHPTFPKYPTRLQVSYIFHFHFSLFSFLMLFKCCFVVCERGLP